MSNKKIAISFAGLGSALLALLAKVADEHKVDLTDIHTGLTELEKLAEGEKNTIISESKGVIEDLKNQLTEALEQKLDSVKLPTIKIGNVTYLINHGDHPHTAQELAERPELVKEILKIKGQNTITPLK